MNTFSIAAVLGIILCIIGSCTDNVGVTLQKLAHRRNGYVSRTWFLGLSLYVFGQLFNIGGLVLAPASMAASLGSLAIVINVLNSKLWLGEAVTRYVVIGTCIVLTGSACAVIFGSHHHGVHVDCLHAIVQHLISPVFLSYLVTVSVLSLILSIAIHYTRRPLILGVLYPMVAGIMGSFTALLTKTASEVYLSETGYKHPLPYILSIVALAIGIAQIWMLNRGLAVHMQLVVVPVFSVSLQTFNIISSLIYFDEYFNLSSTEKLLFPLAVLVNFIGVFIISSGLKQYQTVPITDGNTEEVLLL